MAAAVPFPDSLPPGYEWFPDEPAFDPDRHLQLEDPDDIVELGDLGYSREEIGRTATPIAVSSPFRVLSDEGAATMLSVARRLRPFAQRAGDRIENTVRGGCYRSRWLRDLCVHPLVTAHLARVYRTPITPHPMGLQLGHLNYEPSDVTESIDKWHHDTLPLDYVLAVTDPTKVQGGRFEYFLGTKDEAAELARRGLVPRPERTVVPIVPGPGWAVALHGNMVVHRAAPLERLSERVTMVNGYVPLANRGAGQSRSADLVAVDDPNVLWTEWARYAAWQSVSALQSVVDGLEWTSDRTVVLDELEGAIAAVRRAIEEIRSAEGSTEHYGG